MSASPPDQPQPSQEEIDAYFAELRQAPVRDLLLQAISVLGTGAEVKLGQPDARVLIDCMEVLVRTAGPALEDAGPQLAEGVGQLKMAQVQVEQQVAGQGGPSAASDQAPAPGSGAPPAAAAPQAAPAPAAPAAANQKATDKLWIPGRDG